MEVHRTWKDGPAVNIGCAIVLMAILVTAILFLVDFFQVRHKAAKEAYLREQMLYRQSDREKIALKKEETQFMFFLSGATWEYIVPGEFDQMAGSRLTEPTGITGNTVNEEEAKYLFAVRPTGSTKPKLMTRLSIGGKLSKMQTRTLDAPPKKETLILISVMPADKEIIVDTL